MQVPKDNGFPEDDVSLSGEQADCMLHVLMICEIYFFWEVKALLHGNGEVSNPLDLLARVAIANAELRDPHGVDEALGILNDIIKYKIKEDEELHPHQLVVLPLHQEDLYLRQVGV